MKKLALILIALASSNALSTEGLSPSDAFIEYEVAYYSNDASRVEKWLAPNVRISQTLYMGAEKSPVNVSREQLLESMRRFGPSRARTAPSRSTEDIEIKSEETGTFCASAELQKTIENRGRTYLEREKKEVCFSNRSGVLLVTSQKIDIYYRPK